MLQMCKLSWLDLTMAENPPLASSGQTPPPPALSLLTLAFYGHFGWEATTNNIIHNRTFFEDILANIFYNLLISLELHQCTIKL